MSTNTRYTTMQVGAVCNEHLEMLGQPSAGLHLGPAGVKIILAADWSPEELASTERLQVFLSRFKALTVLSLRFPIGPNRDFDLPHASITGMPNHWRPPELLTSQSRLLITIVYVDQYTAQIRRIRALTLDPMTTRHVVASLARTQDDPVSPETFNELVNDFYRQHPTTSSVRRNAMHRGYAGA